MRTAAAVGAVIIGAATVVAATGPAASAAPKCWVGTWKVTSADVNLNGKGLRFKLRGGGGTKLKFAKSGTVTYDFKETRPLTGSGKVQGVPTNATLDMKGKFSLKNKITGSAKGKITAYPKTASGKATLIIRSGLVKRELDIPREVRRSGDMGVVPRKADYTCKGGSLNIKQTHKEPGLTSKTVWRLKRV